MPFPHDLITSNNKNKFEINDPFGLREVVQPVVSISEVEDKITGLGTCFQISPWRWLTAHHVLKDRSGLTFPPNEVGAVGFSPGLIYGQMGFSTTDFFAPITHTLAFKVQDPEPSFMPGPKPPEIVCDIATLSVDYSRLKRDRLVSPLAIATSPPQIGDEVLCMGYPILGAEKKANDALMFFEEQLVGARGKVATLHPKGLSSSNPWPTIEVHGDWEGGMSGGPVVNSHGQIVGVVSRSLPPTDSHPGVGYAVDLSKVDLKGLAPELDLINPGYIFGWGVFRAGKVVGFMPDQETASSAIAMLQADEIFPISLNPKTENWIKLA